VDPEALVQTVRKQQREQQQQREQEQEAEQEQEEASASEAEGDHAAQSASATGSVGRKRRRADSTGSSSSNGSAAAEAEEEAAAEAAAETASMAAVEPETEAEADVDVRDTEDIVAVPETANASGEAEETAGASVGRKRSRAESETGPEADAEAETETEAEQEAAVDAEEAPVAVSPPSPRVSPPAAKRPRKSLLAGVWSAVGATFGSLFQRAPSPAAPKPSAVAEVVELGPAIPMAAAVVADVVEMTTGAAEPDRLGATPMEAEAQMQEMQEAFPAAVAAASPSESPEEEGSERDSAAVESGGYEDDSEDATAATMDDDAEESSEAEEAKMPLHSERAELRAALDSPLEDRFDAAAEAAEAALRDRIVHEAVARMVEELESTEAEAAPLPPAPAPVEVEESGVEIVSGAEATKPHADAAHAHAAPGVGTAPAAAAPSRGPGILGLLRSVFRGEAPPSAAVPARGADTAAAPASPALAAPAAVQTNTPAQAVADSTAMNVSELASAAAPVASLASYSRPSLIDSTAATSGSYAPVAASAYIFRRSDLFTQPAQRMTTPAPVAAPVPSATANFGGAPAGVRPGLLPDAQPLTGSSAAVSYLLRRQAKAEALRYGGRKSLLSTGAADAPRFPVPALASVPLAPPASDLKDSLASLLSHTGDASATPASFAVSDAIAASTIVPAPAAASLEAPQSAEDVTAVILRTLGHLAAPLKTAAPTQQAPAAPFAAEFSKPTDTGAITFSFLQQPAVSKVPVEAAVLATETEPQLAAVKRAKGPSALAAAERPAPLFDVPRKAPFSAAAASAPAAKDTTEKQSQPKQKAVEPVPAAVGFTFGAAATSATAAEVGKEGPKPSAAVEVVTSLPIFTAELATAASTAALSPLPLMPLTEKQTVLKSAPDFTFSFVANGAPAVQERPTPKTSALVPSIPSSAVPAAAPAPSFTPVAGFTFGQSASAPVKESKQEEAAVAKKKAASTPFAFGKPSTSSSPAFLSSSSAVTDVAPVTISAASTPEGGMKTDTVSSPRVFDFGSTERLDALYPAFFSKERGMTKGLVGSALSIGPSYEFVFKL
jgi:hypothetical protein